MTFMLAITTCRHPVFLEPQSSKAFAAFSTPYFVLCESVKHIALALCMKWATQINYLALPCLALQAGLGYKSKSICSKNNELLLRCK